MNARLKQSEKEHVSLIFRKSVAVPVLFLIIAFVPPVRTTAAFEAASPVFGGAGLPSEREKEKAISRVRALFKPDPGTWVVVSDEKVRNIPVLRDVASQRTHILLNDGSWTSALIELAEQPQVKQIHYYGPAEEINYARRWAVPLLGITESQFTGHPEAGDLVSLLKEFLQQLSDGSRQAEIDWTRFAQVFGSETSVEAVPARAQDVALEPVLENPGAVVTRAASKMEESILKAKEEQVRRQVGILTDTLAALRKQFDVEQKENLKLRENVESLQRKLVLTEKGVETRVVELRQMQDLNASLVKEKEKQKEELVSLQKQLQTIWDWDGRAKFEKELLALKEEIQEKKEGLAIKEEEIEELYAQRKKSAGLIASLEKEVWERQQELTRFQEDLKETQSKGKVSSQDLTAAQVAMKELSDKLASAQSELQERQKEILSKEEQLKAKEKNLQKAQTAYQQSLEEREVFKTGYEERIKTLTGQLQNSESALNDLKREMSRPAEFPKEPGTREEMPSVPVDSEVPSGPGSKAIGAISTSPSPGQTSAVKVRRVDKKGGFLVLSVENAPWAKAGENMLLSVKDKVFAEVELGDIDQDGLAMAYITKKMNHKLVVRKGNVLSAQPLSAKGASLDSLELSKQNTVAQTAER